MKSIGRTPEGGYIVVVSEAEHKALSRLAMAVEGVDMWQVEMRDNFALDGPDLASTFGAIRAFTLGKIKANELLQYAKDIQRTLDRATVKGNE